MAEGVVLGCKTCGAERQRTWRQGVCPDGIPTGALYSQLVAALHVSQDDCRWQTLHVQCVLRCLPLLLP